MLTVEDALARVLAVEIPVRTETPSTTHLGGPRQPVVSLVALPPWDNAAMDGYAVQRPTPRLTPVAAARSSRTAMVETRA